MNSFTVAAFSFVVLAACAEPSPQPMRAPVSDAQLRSACDRGWEKMMETWDPVTSLVTGVRDKSKSPPPPDAKNNLYPMHDKRPGGWGPPGVGDAPLICGTALSGLVDKWEVTHDPAVKSDAAKLAKGVLNLAILHGYKGFVCRGFCNDGKTTVSLSSRDQYTHWVHGLWRYCSSSMADPAIVQGYREQIVEVAKFMETRVTAENQWNFGYADDYSKPDYRTICTMWGPEVWPHEAARLPMIYVAAYMATGDTHWKALYEKLIDEALDITLKVKYGGFKDKTPEQMQGRMPCYSLFQCVVSFDPIIAYEKDLKRRARIQEAMETFAGFAHDRQMRAQRDPKYKPYGMCWEGELLLTQLMVPGFRPNEPFRRFLEDAVLREPLERASLCRTAHILAAYWRSRRL